LPSKTKKGVVGLQQLGNTCYMNSGLQCLSNTVELTKYFLSGYHKEEVNEFNPLGMYGKLAMAYGALMKDMWQTNAQKTAPHNLKKTLGARVNRFNGFNQQDSAELINFLVDLIHEDLNRVTNKPFVEIGENANRTEIEIAAEYWEKHTARN
jgi:ubiquitin C-terminal hydrolase